MELDLPPPLIHIIYEYLSRIELDELGVDLTSYLSPINEDRFAYSIYIQGKTKTYSIKSINTLPDYFRYAILLMAKYPTNVFLKLFTFEQCNQYMLPWLAHSPKLSWDESRSGGELLTYAIKHDSELVQVILSNPGFITSIPPEVLKVRLEQCLKSLLYNQALSSWLVSQPYFQADWLKDLFSYTLEHGSNELNHALLTRLDNGNITPYMKDHQRDDPLYEAIRSRPYFIGACLRHRLFTPGQNSYFRLLPHVSLDQAELIAIIKALQVKSHHAENALNCIHHRVRECRPQVEAIRRICAMLF